MDDILSADQELDFVKRLTNLAQIGGPVWQARDDGTFAAPFGERYEVSVKSANGDDSHPFCFSVNSTIAGTVLEITTVRDGEPSDLDEWIGDLYEVAKRRALGLDYLAADLFGVLDDLENADGVA